MMDPQSEEHTEDATIRGKRGELLMRLVFDKDKTIFPPACTFS
mgnify:CR=1 FL=1